MKAFGRPFDLWGTPVSREMQNHVAGRLHADVYWWLTQRQPSVSSVLGRNVLFRHHIRDAVDRVIDPLQNHEGNQHA